MQALGRLGNIFLKRVGPRPSSKSGPKDTNRELARPTQLFRSQCLVGTFHKTGTVLMSRILKELDRQANFGIWNIARDVSEAVRWQVAFDNHSRFANESVDVQTMPCVVVIRDPRDVVISSAYYHAHAREKWLHLPSDRFDGQTYQQKINSLPDMASRFRFEMRNAAGGIIESMLRVRAADEHTNTMFVKLESLVDDVDLVHFQLLFRHLALDPTYMLFALEIARNCSLFSNTYVKRNHVRSGRPAQWITEFDSALNGEFATLFPSAAERLGYLDEPK